MQARSDAACRRARAREGAIVNIAGKFYPDFKCELARVPDAQGRQIRLNGGTIQVLVAENDHELWVSAGWLRSEKDAWESLIEHLVNELSWAVSQGHISKAEIRRRLLAAEVISK